MTKKSIVDHRGYKVSIVLLAITIAIGIATLIAFVFAVIYSTYISEANFALAAKRITADEFQQIRNQYGPSNNIATFLSFIGIPVTILMIIFTKFSFKQSLIEVVDSKNSDQFEVYKRLDK